MFFYLLLSSRSHVGTRPVSPPTAGADDIYARLLNTAAGVVQSTLQRHLKSRKKGGSERRK